MASPTISRRVPRSDVPSQSSAFCYAIIACLLVATTCLFVQSARTALSHVPITAPIFFPQYSSSVVQLADAKATAAGIHRGDILVAINHRPYTGMAVFWQALREATPGTVMLVTVRSPEPNSPERTIALPLLASRRVIDSKLASICLHLIVPAFCFLLGFWVVMVRPRDLSAWLLLGLLLAIGELVSGYPPLDDWGPAVLKVVYTYYLLINSAIPALLFLFGFFFPEPLPFFARTSAWGTWLPWIVVIPYEIYALLDVALVVGSLTTSSVTRLLAPILHSVAVPIAFYEIALFGAFFVLIITKSVIAISADAKRRLRLLYCGAAVGIAPIAVLGLSVYVGHRVDFPDWIASLTVLTFLVFPFTLAYVILVQRAMDVRVVVRQGLQYAFARNSVRVLQFLAIGLVTLTGVALIGPKQKRPRKVSVIGIGLLAIFTIRRLNDRIGDWVDRRFFREAYDAEQVLSELSDGVRGMVEVPSLIRTVAQRISETLHIPRVAVLLGERGPFRPAYALGYGTAPEIVFPPGAGTVKVLARQPEPARVYFDDPHSWLYREAEVTEEDRSRLTQLESELLLPLSARNKLLGFISLGPKLSDEPYSRADLRLLKSVAAQTGLALENAQLISEIADEVAQRERLNSEVQIARDVQERLFPQTLPPIAGVAYAGACRSALGVGGDYYDFLALPEGKLGLAIGDVSGKGIAAALTMASLQASLRSEATRAPDNLAGLMSNVNRLLHEALASNRYATFFYGQYDPASRLLTYVNAGHNPPMLFHSSNGDCSVSRLEASGTVVGLLDNAAYQQAAVSLAPGDVFIAFTDGISEAMNASQEEWGEDRLIDTVKDCLKLPPAEIISCIMKSADNFAAGAKQNDDMTIIVLSTQALAFARPLTTGSSS